MSNLWGTILRILGRGPAPAPPDRRLGLVGGQLKDTAPYPGDFRGPLEITYAPRPDGRPDPGEIVWAWVPFEEDHRQGKDRPVLLIGRDGPWLLGLQLTSKDHDRDKAREARNGRRWVDIGAGSGIARDVRARSGSTGSSASTAPLSAARARCSTRSASPGSSRQYTPAGTSVTEVADVLSAAGQAVEARPCRRSR